jgi:transposase
LDVSQKETTICLVDEQGRRLWRGKAPADPDAITQILHQHGCNLQVGVETGPLMPWLVHGLRGRGLEVICLDARHAKAALAMQLNKNDHNDAEGLAQIVRTGWYRSVQVKSFEAHRLRALLGARRQLVGMTTQLSNHIRGILKVFGLVVGPAHGRSFAERAETLVSDQPEVAVVVRPMLQAWRELKNQITRFDKAVRQEVRQRAECRLLMSVPGIGALSVLAFVSAIEHPDRFRQSRNVGAHLGLTPRQYQSGEVDRSGRISKCGDELVRSSLFEAAGVLLTRVQRWSPLKAWVVRLAQRCGVNKCEVRRHRFNFLIVRSTSEMRR